MSPDGSIVAAVGIVEIHLWDTNTGLRFSRAIDAQAGHLFEVAFHKDGRTVAAGALGSVELRDVVDRRRVGGELRSADRAVYEVVSRRGGRTVVAVREDASIVLWDLRGTQLGGASPSGAAGTVSSSPRPGRRSCRQLPTVACSHGDSTCGRGSRRPVSSSGATWDATNGAGS